MTDYGDIQIDIKLVNHQKQPGTLKCSMQYVLWEPDLIGNKLAIPISTVKSHKISADGKDKVQIRLIINDGTATVSYIIYYVPGSTWDTLSDFDLRLDNI